MSRVSRFKVEAYEYSNGRRKFLSAQLWVVVLAVAIGSSGSAAQTYKSGGR